jgi:hypothetical protein
MRQLATAKQDLGALSQHPVIDEDGESYLVSEGGSGSERRVSESETGGGDVK